MAGKQNRKTIESLLTTAKAADKAHFKAIQEVFTSIKSGESQTLVGASCTKMKKEKLKSVSDIFAEAMTDAAFLSRDSILQLNENFNGLSYGDLLARWNNWLLSSSPYYDRGDILFLRGNIEGYTDPNSFLDMTKFTGNEQRIFFGTAVFMPVITCQFNIGDYLQGMSIENEESMRAAAREYIKDGGPMWATILDIDKNELYRIDDLENYYVETPRFQLSVSESSPLRSRMEYPLEPGVYDSVTAAYCVLLKKLPATNCRIRFGGKGRLLYYTDSVYDVTVLGDQQTQKVLVSAKDISVKRNPNEMLLDKHFLDKADP